MVEEELLPSDGHKFKILPTTQKFIVEYARDPERASYAARRQSFTHPLWRTRVAPQTSDRKDSHSRHSDSKGHLASLGHPLPSDKENPIVRLPPKQRAVVRILQSLSSYKIDHELLRGTLPEPMRQNLRGIELDGTCAEVIALIAISDYSKDVKGLEMG